MDKSHTKEELSICYISTIAAISAIDYEIIRHDADSTDGLIKKWIILDDGRRFNSSLRIQLKSTSSSSQYSDDGTTISYKLEAKNYNDLCMPATTPVILGLLILPEDEDAWINWSIKELLIKGCMYWGDFSKEPVTSNTSKITVKIDKKHVINTETLQALLEKIAKDGEL